MPTIPYRIIRSDRRTLSLEITTAGEVLVRCSRRTSREQIRQFVQSKENWLSRHLAAAAERSALPRLTSAELHSLRAQAAQAIPPRAAHFSGALGVDYGRITIRAQKTRWGSCSGRGNLSFNCLLVLTPPEVMDYVIVHELCHRKEMNHSPRFWQLVEAVLPEYATARRWLKEHGTSLIARL